MASALIVLILLAGSRNRPVYWRLAGVPPIRRWLFLLRRLEPAQGAIRRGDRDLWHPRHATDRDVDRGSGGARRRSLPDGALLAAAASADRHRDRTARRKFHRSSTASRASIISGR